MTTLLVDGNGLACKLWWASSHETHARFASSVARLSSQFSAESVAVAWDSRPPVWRHDLFPGYKAGRPSKPNGLSEALRACRRLPQFSHRQAAGYEADDIIATLAAQAQGRVLILSEDKDFAQLVSDRVQMVNLHGVVVDAEAVIQRWGVPPSKFRLLLSWWGDSADGLPGVRGFGRKKAVARALAGAMGDPLTYELVGFATVPEPEVVST